MTKPAGWRQRLAQRLLGVTSGGTDLVLKGSEEKSLTTGMSLPVWLDGQPHYSDWTAQKAITEGYKVSGMLYACIEIISDAAASVPLIAYRKNADGKWEPSDGEPIQLLVDKPNPFMTRQVMIKRIAQHLLLGGNAIWTKQRFQSGPMKGLPFELWPLSPDGIKPIVSRTEFIESYRWFANGIEEFLEPRDVLHFMQVDPSQPYWGIGSLQAMFKAVETDRAAQDFQRVGMTNRGVVSGVMSFKMPLSKEQYTQARESVNLGISGADNARKILVLGSDASYSAMGMTPEEMDFIETRKLTREEIMQGMRVPPPMVGVYDQATLANIETSRTIFWLDRMMPFLSGIQEVYNQLLTPEFDDSGDLWLGFDTTNVDALQQNIEERVQVYETLVKNRVKPLAAARIAGIDLMEEDVEEKQAPPPNPFGGPVADLGQEVDPQDDEDDGDQPKRSQGVGRSVKRSLPKAAGDRAFDRWSSEQKDRYWKQIDDARTAWETRLAQKADELLQAEQERIIKFLQDGVPAEVAIDRGVDVQPWKNAFEAYYMAGMEFFMLEAYDRFFKAGYRVPLTKADFARLTVSDLSWAVNRAASKVVQITDSTRQTLMQTILSGESRTIDEQAKRIREAYAVVGTDADSVIDYHRSYVIARTEMGGIVNYSNQNATKMAGMSLGYKMTKTWLSSRDARVRSSHIDMDGETVPMDEKYSNGLMFPSDPDSGKPSEVIQCRCVEMYDLDESQPVQQAWGGVDQPAPGSKPPDPPDGLGPLLPGQSLPPPKPPKKPYPKPPGKPTVKPTPNSPTKPVTTTPHPPGTPIQTNIPDSTWNPGSDSFRLIGDDFSDQFSESYLRGVSSAAEVRAAKNYSGDAYTTINSYLRGKTSQISTRFKTQIGHLKSFLNRQELSLPRDVNLWRGYRFRGGIPADRTKMIGTVLSDDAFVSSSLNPETARMFASMGGGPDEAVILRIRAKAGTRGAYLDAISENQGEFEFLLPPGQQMQVVGLETYKGSWGGTYQVLVVDILEAAL